MSETACRQCGKTVALADFPTGEFVCPECGWRELMPNAVAQRSRSRQEHREEGGGIATLECTEAGASDPEPEVAMETAEVQATPTTPTTPFEAVDLDHIASMASEDFIIWCARLFTRFGFTVAHDAGSVGGECDLKITRDGETTFVDCVSVTPSSIVEPAVCQRLVGALVGAGARRGIVMTTGASGDACRAFIDRLADDYSIDFIGGERLEETVQEMMTGPLAVWWR